MDLVDLQAKIREGKGKELNKKLRDTGLVPAIVYKKGEDSVSLIVERKGLVNALNTEAGENVIIKMHIDGVKKRKERTVIVKEIQKNPFKDSLLHVDFQEISLTETLKVNVPIVGKGEPVGVKQEGGVLQQVLWEAEIECLPTDIPEKIEVDISNLKIGQSIHVKEINAPRGVKILNDPEGVVVSIEHVKGVEEIVTAPAEGEALEPEVIREKKEKPEEGAEEATEKEKPAEKKKDEGGGSSAEVRQKQTKTEKKEG